MTPTEPLLCDLAEEMQTRVAAYRAGWVSTQGYVTIPVETLERWAAGMERASLAIEGPAD